MEPINTPEMMSPKTPGIASFDEDPMLFSPSMLDSPASVPSPTFNDEVPLSFNPVMTQPPKIKQIKTRRQNTRAKWVAGAITAKNTTEPYPGPSCVKFLRQNQSSWSRKKKQQQTKQQTPPSPSMQLPNPVFEDVNYAQLTKATATQNPALTQQRLIQAPDNLFYGCPILDASNVQKSFQRKATDSHKVQTSIAQTQPELKQIYVS